MDKIHIGPTFDDIEAANSEHSKMAALISINSVHMPRFVEVEAPTLSETSTSPSRARMEDCSVEVVGC